jgi:GH25 family lysozyme M1 (1,4-beta-N-acetylmuramidase)
MTTLDGPDISHYQWDAGPVSLATTRQSCDWFATKLTQSTGYLDPTAARARTQANALEFRCVGLYHWLSSTTDPVLQAAWFLKNVGTLRTGEFAMLDDEEGGVTVAKSLAWLEAVEAVTKRPSAVYTGAYVAGGTIWTDPRIREGKYGRRPMILAAYTTEAKARALPGVAAHPWSSWQYSSNGPCPGVTGRCDLNRVDDWAVYDLACGRSAPAHPNVLPPTPTEAHDMPCIILGRGAVALLDAGYATGLSDATFNKNTSLPVLSLTDDEWDRVLATSDDKKKADAALGTGIEVNVPPIVVPPITVPTPHYNIMLSGTASV